MSKVIVIYQQRGREFEAFQLESTLHPCTGRNRRETPTYLEGRIVWIKYLRNRVELHNIYKFCFHHLQVGRVRDSNSMSNCKTILSIRQKSEDLSGGRF